MGTRIIKWLGLAASLTMIVACLMEWVIIRSKNLTITGIDDGGVGFGKPGYLHFIFTFLFIAFTLIPKIWAKRFNLAAAPLNLAWAIRNYFTVSACSGGECPDKQLGLFLVLLAAIVMLVSALFPDLRLRNDLRSSSGLLQKK
jgi:hypothetical protein